MDAASSASLTEFVNHSVSRMDRQQESITGTERAVQALVTQVSELTQQCHLLRNPTAPPTPPVPLTSPEPRLPVPESYTGEPNFCRAFLTRCSMHFSLQPRTFEREESKVAFVLTLLTGRAALWGTAVEVCTGSKLKPEPGPYPRLSDPTRPEPTRAEQHS